MSAAPTPEMFSSFAKRVKAVLAAANVPISDAHNSYTLGTRAHVGMGTDHDAQHRLCAVVYRVQADDLNAVPDKDAPIEYKTILESAGYVVKADQVKGGWAVWTVYPPDVTDPASIEMGAGNRLDAAASADGTPTSASTSHPTFPRFAEGVEAVLAQANVSIADSSKVATPGMWAHIVSGHRHDPQNRLCAVVYRTKLTDPEQTWERDAPPEYKAILERAGYVVKASRVPGGLDGGWAVWAVYPPPDATEP